MGLRAWVLRRCRFERMAQAAHSVELQCALNAFQGLDDAVS